MSESAAPWGVLSILSSGMDDQWPEEEFTAAEKTAIAFFEANEAALFSTLCAALSEQVLEEEAEAEARAARQMATSMPDREAVYGELFEEEEDEAFGGLFGADEDVDEDIDEGFEEDLDAPPPFSTRFTIYELVLVSRGAKCLFGFRGAADWDEEHGLGVLMDGFEIVEIGDHSTVR